MDGVVRLGCVVWTNAHEYWTPCPRCRLFPVCAVVGAVAWCGAVEGPPSVGCPWPRPGWSLGVESDPERRFLEGDVIGTGDGMGIGWDGRLGVVLEDVERRGVAGVRRRRG